MSITGFEPRISGVGSDRTTNWATTTRLIVYLNIIFNTFCALKQCNNLLTNITIDELFLCSPFCLEKAECRWMDGVPVTEPLDVIKKCRHWDSWPGYVRPMYRVIWDATGCVTRSGYFWKFLATKFLAKEAQMNVQLLGLFWKTSLLCKMH